MVERSNVDHHTTFKIGGPADVMVTPTTPEALVRVLDTCYLGNVPVTVVGNGSDLLVGDRGVRGVVVLLRDNLSEVELDASRWRVTAQAGALLRDVALPPPTRGSAAWSPCGAFPPRWAARAS